MKIKRVWQDVDGVLLLDKPSGMTSNDALQKARRLYSAAKAGHTGTLDPLASGLLPLCFGEATKFSADLLNADKAYLAEVKLGVTTDTGDAEGEAVLRRPVNVAQADVMALLPRFSGEIEQVPPMYSALKRDGRPLYELARQGIEVERQARRVTIHRLSLEQFSGDSLTLAVDCSKGTYIRTLAADIGEALGCGAHLTALRRTRVGDLTLDHAVPLAALQAADATELARWLQPVDSLLKTLPTVQLNEDQAGRFSHGNAAAVEGLPLGPCRVYAAGCLLGLGEASDGLVRPKRLLRQKQ
jgi:tRNA pseudouridine55 synthase